MALLDVLDLSVTYTPRDSAAVRAVNGVSFSIEEGEFVGLLGESGCGKSTLGHAVLRLLEKPAAISGGSVVFDGRDITALPEEELRSLRWVDLSTVFQSSMNSLNPVITVGEQFADCFEAHPEAVGDDLDLDRRAGDLLEMVSLSREVLRRYPHELSGGMKQRVALALALALRPKFVLLDEPTTGLDVVVQREILDRLAELRAELGFAVLFISHDLGTVVEMADRVMVMYGGELVEDQPADAIVNDHLHPYTAGLMGSYADPRDEHVEVAFIPGRPPDLSRAHEGCLFEPRCPVSVDACRTDHPDLLPAGRGEARCLLVEQAVRDGVPAQKAAPLDRLDAVFAAHAQQRGAADAEPVLVVDGVSKTYKVRRGGTSTTTVAVQDASFVLRPGRVTALVGQSGSGKTTIARLVTGVERPTSGTITFGEQSVGRLGRRALRRYRSHVQLVFQDPFSALNPTRTIAYAISRPLRNYLGLDKAGARTRAAELLETVGLSPAGHYLDKLPHQLSGGQRQRVVIARALASEPEVLVADEPISMLDVSIRAEIVALLDDLVRQRGIAMLYITHDLLSARLLADEVMVLNQGEMVEQGPTLEVIREARDPYTRRLLAAIPRPGSAKPGGARPGEPAAAVQGAAGSEDVAAPALQ
jgi:oligopeptide/dipeptide ABC transporter ATP-binding protein